jgi:hypothetical protein
MAQFKNNANTYEPMKTNYTFLDTIQGRISVAEFMGYTVKWVHDTSPDGDSSYPLFIKDGITTSDYYPDKHWHLLMPVAEKIFLLKEVKDVIIRFGEVKIILENSIEIKSPHSFENDAKTELWLVIVDFLKWYNQNKES